MNIRLVGTVGECAVAVQLISQVLPVLDISEPYKNRGISALVRVYVEARIPVGTAQSSEIQGKEIGK